MAKYRIVVGRVVTEVYEVEAESEEEALAKLRSSRPQPLLATDREGLGEVVAILKLPP
jgi:hypothetical protein